MPSPGWTEVPLTNIPYDELPIDWQLNADGTGMELLYIMGTVGIATTLSSGPDPGWIKILATPLLGATEWTVTPMTWTEVLSDS